MLNTTLPHIEAEYRKGLAEHYVNSREKRDGWPAIARANPLKSLLADVWNCSVAHWYLMPGLEFHRFRVRLALSTIVSKKKELRNVIIQVLDQTIRPTAFFEFDFAWKAVASREPLGTYLDYSSPWLFPAMLLAKRHCERPMVLDSDFLGIEAIERLAKNPPNEGRRAIGSRIKDGAFTSELFDVVTSLSSIDHVADDVGILKQLWGAVKPGGMLLLSLPCTGRAVKGDPDRKTFPPFAQKFKERMRRLYDEQMLQERVFAVVGRPRRYVVYGESNPATDRHLATPGNVMAIARGWQTYSDLRDIPGEGLIAMKFLKRLAR